MKPIVEIRDFEVVKEGRSICRVAELTVAVGERIGIVGANGSGKTTLLRVLAGLERDDRGVCRIGVSPRQRAYLHQSPRLFRGSVLFNAAYGLAARGVPRRDYLRTARQWLEALGVRHLADRRSLNLSGGEQRRVALARVLALEPQLLLLDEPFADLDDSGAQLVREALSRLTASTVLIASPVPLPDGVVERTYENENV